MTEVEVSDTPPKPTRQNPLLSRRMVNAYARLDGCGEFSPETECEHRINARRLMMKLMELYEVEKG